MPSSDDNHDEEFANSREDQLLRAVAAVPSLDRIVTLVATPGASTSLVAVDVGAVRYADDGVRLDSTENAAIELDDTPSGGQTELTSLWQTGSVAIRAEHYIHWRIRSGGAAYLTLS